MVCRDNHILGVPKVQEIPLGTLSLVPRISKLTQSSIGRESDTKTAHDNQPYNLHFLIQLESDQLAPWVGTALFYPLSTMYLKSAAKSLRFLGDVNT